MRRSAWAPQIDDDLGAQGTGFLQGFQDGDKVGRAGPHGVDRVDQAGQRHARVKDEGLRGRDVGAVVLSCVTTGSPGATTVPPSPTTTVVPCVTC